MKISIHRNKLRFVLYIKLTCTWFKICILICCVCVIVRLYYKRNTANSLPFYIIKMIKQMHAWNEQILKLKFKLAARCAVSGCWPSCCNLGCYEETLCRLTGRWSAITRDVTRPTSMTTTTWAKTTWTWTTFRTGAKTFTRSTGRFPIHRNCWTGRPSSTRPACSPT